VEEDSKMPTFYFKNTSNEGIFDAQVGVDFPAGEVTAVTQEVAPAEPENENIVKVNGPKG